MGGIVFLRTAELVALVEFYTRRLEMVVWLEQPGCTIFQHGNLLLGFCERENPETDGMITLVYDSREEVDRMYEKISDVAEGRPHENVKYRIYQFFARDPEGRALEFQVFLHPTPSV